MEKSYVAETEKLSIISAFLVLLVPQYYLQQYLKLQTFNNSTEIAAFLFKGVLKCSPLVIRQLKKLVVCGNIRHIYAPQIFTVEKKKLFKKQSSSAFWASHPEVRDFLRGTLNLSLDI